MIKLDLRTVDFRELMIHDFKIIFSVNDLSLSTYKWNCFLHAFEYKPDMTLEEFYEIITVVEHELFG